MAVNFGSEYIYNTSVSSTNSVCAISSTSFVCASATSTAIKLRIGTVSGSTISYGTEASISISTSLVFTKLAKFSSTSFVILYLHGNSLRYVIGTISGTTISVGSYTQIVNSVNNYNPSLDIVSSTQFIVSYTSYSNSNIYAVTCTTDGSVGSSLQLTSSGNGGLSSISILSSSRAWCFVGDVQGSIDLYDITLSGGGPVSSTKYSNYITYTYGTYDQIFYLTSIKIPSINKCLFSFSIGQQSTSSIGYICYAIDEYTSYKYEINGSSYSSYVGLNAVSSTAGNVVFTDNSNSSYGKTKSININSYSLSFDTAVTYNSGTTAYNSTSALDANNFVVVYKDVSNSNQSIGIIGQYPALGKKINGITYSKWNGTAITKFNNI